MKNRKIPTFFALAAILGFSSAELFAREAEPYQYSSAQAKYLKNRGKPDLFLLLFVTKEVDAETGAEKRVDPPRRIETWLYTALGRRVMFDDGILIKETRFDSKVLQGLLPETELDLTEYSPEISPKAIKRRFGQPDNIEKLTVGKQNFQVYRYMPKESQGVKSFTFLDDQLVGVAAGIGIVPKK